MSSWETLSAEIVNNIFRNLERFDIIQCSTISRAWRSVALRILFEHLEPKSQNDMVDLVKVLSTAVNSNYQSPGNFVKTLKLHYYSGLDIALVDKLFPFLQNITNAENIEPYKNILYPLLKKGRFRNLKKTPFTELDKDHLELMLARKEDIRELELQNIRYDNLVDELLEILTLLHKLESLEMDFPHLDNDVAISLETLLSKAPSTLKSIDLKFDSKITFTTIHSNPSTIQPLSAVKEVKITYYQLHFIGEKDYLYIMKKFPRVESLEFIFNPNLKAIQNYRVPTVESLFQSLKYLFDIRISSSVPAIITNELTAEAIKTFFNYVLTQRLSSTTFKDVEIHLKLDFKARKAEAEQDLPIYIIPNNQFHYGKKVCKIEVHYETIISSRYQPYLELLRQIGYMDIKYLMIEDSSWLYDLRLRTIISLDIIFDTFVNSKKLVFLATDFLTFTEELASNEEKPKSNLECLEFHFSDLKQNMFPYLSELCPNLKVLKLSACRFPSPSGTGHRTNFYKVIYIVMPSTRLQELHFSVSMSPNDLYEFHPYKKAVIRFETSEDEPKYFTITFGDDSDSDSGDEFQSEDDIDSGDDIIDSGGDIDSGGKNDSDKKSFQEVGYVQCTEEEYENYVEDELCFVYIIYCESIAELFFETEPCYPKF